MIVLFDVDGTLTTGSRWGATAMDLAIEELVGVAGATHAVHFAGSIDGVIVREALAACDRWPTETAAGATLVRQVLRRYQELFLAGLAAAPYRALPAARPAVESARARATVVGLATGNVEEAAHAKLASAGLGGLFASRSKGGVGGYGDDGATRTDVVRAAIELARQRRCGSSAIRPMTSSRRTRRARSPSASPRVPSASTRFEVRAPIAPARTLRSFSWHLPGERRVVSQRSRSGGLRAWPRPTRATTLTCS